MNDTQKKELSEALRRADVLEDEGDLAGAIALLSAEIAKAPQLARLYALRGRLSSLRKAYADAISDFDVALSLRPTAATTLYFRARAKAFNGDSDGALADHAACLILQPLSADALYEMGTIHEDRHNLEEALDLFGKAKRIASKAPKGFKARADLDARIRALRARLGLEER